MIKGAFLLPAMSDIYRPQAQVQKNPEDSNAVFITLRLLMMFLLSKLGMIFCRQFKEMRKLLDVQILGFSVSCPGSI